MLKPNRMQPFARIIQCIIVEKKTGSKPCFFFLSKPIRSAFDLFPVADSVVTLAISVSS